eukprot:365312-Chlamydomonas_euryale.AAC.11
MSDSSGSEGVKAVDPTSSKRINSITDVATQMIVGGCGRGQQKVWKCNGFFKKLTKICGFERKGGQRKLLEICLACHGWPIPSGLCCMGSLDCVLLGWGLQSFLCLFTCPKLYCTAQVSGTVHPAQGEPFSGQSNPANKSKQPCFVGCAGVGARSLAPTAPPLCRLCRPRQLHPRLCLWLYPAAGPADLDGRVGALEAVVAQIREVSATASQRPAVSAMDVAMLRERVAQLEEAAGDAASGSDAKAQKARFEVRRRWGVDQGEDQD